MLDMSTRQSMLGLITQSAATSALKVTPAKPAEVIAEQKYLFGARS